MNLKISQEVVEPAFWSEKHRTIQEEPTYVCKPMNLKEYEFGVPEQGGAKREQLAYLFDKNHFAGVPPTFVVDLRDVNLEFALYNIMKGDAHNSTIMQIKRASIS